MGMAFIYFPFFIGAHLSAHLLDYNTYGFSKPYKMALVFSTVFYLWLGLFFLRKTLVRYYSELVTSLTLIFITFGTNFFHYATIDAPMPHIYCFALFGIFIYLTIKWYDESSIKYSILLGLVGGMITLVRPTNAIIALFFIFYKITSFSDIKMRLQYFLKHYNYIFLIIVIAFLLWVPQFLYWKKVTGHFLFFSYGEERFFFDHPRIFKGLFSYRNGWLLYSPVMIFSLMGIPLLLHQIKSIFFPVLIFTLVNIYIVLSWWCWWYTGFGNRAMIDSYAILSFPMAAFIDGFSAETGYVFY